jgi:hypothetical protein
LPDCPGLSDFRDYPHELMPFDVPSRAIESDRLVDFPTDRSLIDSARKRHGV